MAAFSNTRCHRDDDRPAMKLQSDALREFLPRVGALVAALEFALSVSRFGQFPPSQSR
ncbi:hypothetical protein [Caballeronia temeraria]|uniref:hypothetical protein n=1 Tax=Caballeronia temeraria TaxID=1777137 RepID=UPI0012FDD2D8|nr:hypothetical protein [Caballeronia temeraria]